MCLTCLNTSVSLNVVQSSAGASLGNYLFFMKMRCSIGSLYYKAHAVPAAKDSSPLLQNLSANFATDLQSKVRPNHNLQESNLFSFFPINTSSKV
mmetsp:Transcript_39086/g.58115  ORF Transcript_39086/g.58115 Transcript_39086/m.58115 type:complete len:95 (-) Transcript_39086:593-877(-)